MSVKRVIRRLWRSSPHDLIQRLRAPRKVSAPGGPEVKRYVWCLSTGRVGTKTLAVLANLSEQVEARHEPEPQLYGLSKQAYEHDGEEAREILGEALKACRPPVQAGGAEVYFESSPQATFLAAALRDLFSGSRFVHLVRHPGAILRSGMRRGWYAGHRNDGWRLVPQDGEAAASWNEWSLLKKNAWLWGETNRWIEDFMETLPAGAGLRIRSEDLFEGQPEAVASFFDHLGAAQPSSAEVEKVLGKKLNRQQSGDFPEFADWTDEQRLAVESQVGLLMKEYRYPNFGCA